MKTLESISTPEDVLSFWFDPPAVDQAGVLHKVRRWFQGGPDMDREVIERFGTTVEAALGGRLDEWTITSRGRLALVLVLDQLTRNVYRGDPKTYSGDPIAQRLALEAFDRGLDRELAYVERVFLSMPLLHSEDPSHQARVREIVDSLAPTAPAEYRQLAAMHVEQAHKFGELIERFGRFPHRNEILGRASTQAEQAFLVDWAQKGPPTGAHKAQA
jgi:uncharacterized protein (DUF924 family)